MHKLGPTQKKILLLLTGGLVLGLSRSSRQYYKTLKAMNKEWKKITQGNFTRSVLSLSKEKLIEERRLADGSFKLVLTEEGRKQARTLEIFGNAISFKKKKRLDGKWRIVMFDIPEKERLFRDILRNHLYELDFYKLQNSVFVSPHPCEKAILDLVMLYNAGAHVRVIIAERIDNEDRIKKHFAKDISLSS